MRKRGRCNERRILYPHPVVKLVFLLESPQYGYRLLYRRLAYVDGLEPSFQGSIFFHILPVFVESRRSDTPKFSSRQRRFQHIRGVDCTLGTPCTNDGMEFIDKENNPTGRFIDFLKNGLQSVLKFTPVFRPCEHGPKVKGKDLFVLQCLRNIAGHDPLCKSFNYGGFSYAGFTDDDRVIFCPPGKNLHNPSDFLIPPYNGIKLSLPGFLGKIPAVLLEGLIFLLRCLIRYPLSPSYLLQNRINAVFRNAISIEYPPGRAITCVCNPDQKVLGTRIFIFQTLCFSKSRIKGLLQPGSNVGLRNPLYRGHLLEFRFKVVQDYRRVRAQFIQYRPHDTIFLRHQCIQNVFIVDALMVQRFGLLLSLRNCLLSFNCQLFPIHRLTSSFVLSSALPRAINYAPPSLPFGSYPDTSSVVYSKHPVKG
ncbi:MAG: hypothetical protein A4E58_03256 [Syntrophorhabdus sp. PtaB.Bin006]|nr:MAG: hypothetical protein A4E58_03256 [Syntrophorhabdus sp. PtaB.Bin006]